MKPINFKQENTLFKTPSNMTTDQCDNLPAYVNDVNIISCWHLTLKERITLLFMGKLWLNILSKTMPPVSITIESPFIDSKEKYGY